MLPATRNKAQAGVLLVIEHVLACARPGSDPQHPIKKRRKRECSLARSAWNMVTKNIDDGVR
jgi:hypothetical protein